jgi:hypothetical protein
MSDTELPRELQAILRRLAAEDAPELLEQARSGALPRARKLLEDALVRELVQAAAQSRAVEPGSEVRAEAAGEPAVGEAWWSYCVLAADAAPDIARGLHGVEPGTGVEVVTEGPVAALVSAVPYPEYGDERLRQNLEDIEWLERVARAHEAVQARALEATTIVPLRLCTLYREQDGVRRFLNANADSVLDSLARLDGCAEWGLKLFAGRPPSASPAAATDAERSGAGYLAQRRQERALADEATERRALAAEKIHDRMTDFAREATLNPPQRPELHGREETMVLNGAYLVERSREPALEQLVERLRSEFEPAGFVLELTGPWPAYNFVSSASEVIA